MTEKIVKRSKVSGSKVEGKKTRALWLLGVTTDHGLQATDKLFLI